MTDPRARDARASWPFPKIVRYGIEIAAWWRQKDRSARGGMPLIVHVEEPPMVYGYGAAYYGALDPGVEQQREMLERLVPDDPQVPYEHRLIQGAPADAIVRLANEESVDLIVMGTHGRTGITRVLMGSVAEDVVRHAQCSVLTFKQPHGKPQQEDR